jgi:hypothetical protein
MLDIWFRLPCPSRVTAGFDHKPIAVPAHGETGFWTLTFGASPSIRSIDSTNDASDDADLRALGTYAVFELAFNHEMSEEWLPR